MKIVCQPTAEGHEANADDARLDEYERRYATVDHQYG